MNKHKSNKIKENSDTVRHLIMGQIITTQNLVAIKEVRHAGQQATGLDARASRVNVLHSLCRIVMEYYLSNMFLKATICHIIMAKSHLIV